MYLRFVIARRDPDAHVRQGIFVATAALLKTGELAPYEEELLIETRAWFREHLHAPEVLQEPHTCRAICWFRPTAQEPIAHIWDIVPILEAHGRLVELIKTHDPGSWLYADRWQVVAWPRHRSRAVNATSRLWRHQPPKSW